MDEEDIVYSHVLRRAADALKQRLQQRIDELDHADLTAEQVLGEIQRQVSEAGVDGHLTRASDLSDLAIELVMAKEHNRGLL
jgi:hypothetical protein